MPQYNPNSGSAVRCGPTATGWDATCPDDVRTGGELAAYATWCETVEGNTTFYATPPSTTIDRWLAETPDGFQFCFKLPRTITHERRLRNAADLTDEFCERIAPLGERLGPDPDPTPPFVQR